MRPIDKQAMILVAATVLVDQLSKQLLMTWLAKTGAVVTVIVINRTQPQWGPREVKAGGNVRALIGTVIATGAVMAIHNWLGVQPWGG